MPTKLSLACFCPKWIGRLSLQAPDTLPEPPGAHIGALRRRRFLYAVLTSGTSKVLALIVQLLALPFALRVLGMDRYATFLTLQSFVSWTGIFGLGLVPALPKFIAAARAAGDRDSERSLIVSSFVAIGAISFLVFLGFVILGLVVPPAHLVSAHHVATGELNAGYFMAVAVSALSLLASIDPAIRAGGQELHRSNICAVAANVVVLVGLSFLAHHAASLWSFFVILNMPMAVLLLLDLLSLFFERPYLARGKVGFRDTARAISPHSNNALMIQAAFAMILYLPTLAVAHLSNARQTAIFGSIALQLFFALASMNLIIQPLTAAMANAHSHHDTRWVARGYWNSLALVSGIGLFAVAVSGTAGPWLVTAWLGPAIAITHLMGATFGLFFLMLCLAQLHFYVLSAAGGLPGTGKLYLFQGLVGLSLGSVLCLWYGAEGMALGLTLAMAAIGWMLPVAMIRELKTMASTAQA
jgi:O-antigen/teichoic acid export membrane protein